MWKKLLETSKNSNKNLRIKDVNKIIDTEEDASKLKNTLKAAMRRIEKLEEQLKIDEQQLKIFRDKAPVSVKIEAEKVRKSSH